jgi:hypothetical protein
MHKKPMRARRIQILILALILVHAGLRSQDRYFLYIQTENGQPFYARFQGRTLSSSGIGYLILPKISDSVSSIVIGFPKKLFPEQSFRINGIRSDRGFMLKNLGDKGWALIDMQLNDMVMAISPDVPATPVAKVPVSSDAFSELLSTAIADSTLMETPVVVKNASSVATSVQKSSIPKDVVSQPVSTLDVADRPDTLKKVEAVQKVLPAPVLSETAIASKGKNLKIMEQIDATGIQLVYEDPQVNGSSDTISVWIPLANAMAAPSKPSSAARLQPAVKPSADSVAISIPDRKDCKGLISVKDLGLLRRRMETVVDEDAKVGLALRSFREVCFNAEQIRSLLVVFGREEGRFKLLDAAYSYVADPSRFSELESVLKDPYFIYRFQKKTSQAPVR